MYGLYSQWKNYRKGIDSARHLYDWFSKDWNNIHPDEETFRRQQRLKTFGLFGKMYGSYLEQLSLQEKNAHTMELYSIDFSDIKYPHLSPLLSSYDSVANASSSWQFSDNIKKLYR